MSALPPTRRESGGIPEAAQVAVGRNAPFRGDQQGARPPPWAGSPFYGLTLFFDRLRAHGVSTRGGAELSAVFEGGGEPEGLFRLDGQAPGGPVGAAGALRLRVQLQDP